MHRLKFNGILQEIKEQYPNIDIMQFLQEKLGLPDYKAEELAARIEKTCLQKTNKIEKKSPRTILERISKQEFAPKPNAYSLDCLSEKEFGFFIIWLLDALGFEVHPEKHPTRSGFDLVATKDNETIAIQARNYPKTYDVSDSIVLISQEAKRIYECKRSIVLVTAYFTHQAKHDAQRLNVEFWDKDIIASKIDEVRKKANLKVQPKFPQYKGSLLQSLLKFEETADFMIEPRSGGRYDLHLAGVKFPLLTFQADGEEVFRCVYRINDDKPVREHEGINLISRDKDNKIIGPNEIQAYKLIIQYLEQFLT